MRAANSIAVMGGSRRQCLGRGTLVAVAVLGLLSLVAPAAAASAQGGGGERVATVTADGWWSATPALPSTVGDQGLAVGARAGEADKIAAVAFHLALAAGDELTEAVLELQEVAAPGAVVPPAAEGAVVRACPITRAWTAEKNGALDRAPEYDCRQAAPPGVRSADRSWRFNLGVVARRWADGSMVQHGVALVPSVEAPTTFQVAFQDRTTGTPRLRVATSGPAASGRRAGAASAAGQGAPAGGAPVASPPVGRVPPSVTSLDLDRTEVAPGGAPADAAAGGVPRLGVTPAEGGDPSALGALPASALLLVPALLALALGACLVIGDDRSADEGRRRQGAVSRALAGTAPAP